jgi:predicted outer membrane repeat protein
LVIASLVFGLGMFSMTALTAQVASAATQTVTNCNDSGSGSLRQAVLNANSGDIIAFALSPSCSTITLSSTIDIDTSVTIAGSGASALAVSGDGAVGVVEVASAVTVSISGLTIEDGNAEGGGGIFNNGTLTVTNSTLSNNTANNAGVGGGGIYNDGTLTVANSTLSGNIASGGNGGGIYNVTTATVNASTLSGNSASQGGGIFNATALIVTDSTLSNNSASEYGGGINGEGTVTSSTLSNNSAGFDGGGIYIVTGGISVAATIVTDSAGRDCFDGGYEGGSSITDAGYNLDSDGTCGFSGANHSQSGVDPDLGALQANGGPTETQAPGTGSPVLNQIPLGTLGNGIALCPGADQRGTARPQGTECDIGAVELVVSQAKAITSAESAATTVRTSFSFTVTTTGSPVPRITKTGSLPKYVKLTDNGDGTATISGTPKKTGTYHLKIRATFGKGKTKTVVTQAFTLTVNPA